MLFLYRLLDRHALTMSQKCNVIDSHKDTIKKVTPSSSSNAITDWKTCVICQEDTSEKLVNPGLEKFRGTEKASGYKVFSEHIHEFNKLRCLPATVHISRLDNGEGIEATLKTNNALWH